MSEKVKKKSTKKVGLGPPKIRPAKSRLSVGAQTVHQVLISHNIINHLEYTLGNHCKDKKPLPYDFQVIVNGRVGLIEYDGEQHFKFPSKFHTTGSAFDKQRKHDRLKTQTAYDENLSLLRLAYDIPMQHLEKIVLTFLDEMKSGKSIYRFCSVNSKLYDYLPNPKQDCCIM